LKRSIRSSSEIRADFIVIGGGTAGCIVSSRLAEYGFETLLLSRGSNDRLNPLLKENFLFDQLLHTPYLKHYLPTNSSSYLNHRILDIIVRNTFGGNSINDSGIQRLIANDWNYFLNATRSWNCDSHLTSTQKKYPNLKVLTGSTAIKFNMNKKTKKIENVLFISKDGLFIGIARKEYILSAGTFFSPHLLMLSGIGDPQILQANAIPIKHQLKQVGKNLIDNKMLIMKFQTQNFSIGQSFYRDMFNGTK
jgi:choline dehydrogenase-like flavoprotein